MEERHEKVGEGSEMGEMTENEEQWKPGTYKSAMRSRGGWGDGHGHT